MSDSAIFRYCADPEHVGPNPLLIAEFSKSSLGKNGLQSRCRACRARQRTSYQDRIRDQVFSHYGKLCACPGCGTAVNLTIDHIDGNGAAHRAELFGSSPGGNSTRFYRWLVTQGFPDGYQVLCSPCNNSKARSLNCRLAHADGELKCCPRPGHTGPNPLPPTAFSLNRSKRDGRSGWCRECTNCHRLMQREAGKLCR